jgi:spermidine synthase
VYHPWIDGAGTLYTREHFETIRARLAEGGIFCQWLPLHQLDLATLRIIVRTFLSAYPGGKAYLAQFSIGTPLIGLVGSNAAQKYPDGWLEQRVKDPGLRQKLAAIDLTDDMALFGSFLADSDDLARFAGPGPLNTDDHQLVTFQAPSAAYFMAESPGARLVSLLSAFHPQAKAILQRDKASEGARLAAYWRARDRYLALGESTMHAPLQGNIPKQLGPQLVDVVRLSADFDAAYRPVLAMAQQLANSDRSAARHLLEDLERANPNRPEAGSLLSMLPAD